MAAPPSDTTPNPNPAEEIEEDDNNNDDFEEEDEEEPEEQDPAGARTRMETLFNRLSTERVPVRVHDIIIKGNTKTQDALIESEVAPLLKDAATVQQLLRAAAQANARLHRLDIFDSVSITLDAGPPELPGTANVVVEVTESKNPLTGDFGVFSKPEARSWSLEGSLKLKNLFGYGDLWDGSVAYGWGQASEVSAGVSVPKFIKPLLLTKTPFTARLFLSSQDWLKFSSYKDQALGLSLGLFSRGNHDLSYNVAWRTLTDPSQMASHDVRRQLGHGLLSGFKYAFKKDLRDSAMRPTRGYAVSSTTQLGGFFPDSRALRFIRQEVEFRQAVPLGFFGAAFNIGVAAGVVLPWGGRNGFFSGLNSSYLPERFFMGSNSSPICTLGGGPTSLLGFKARGLGPTDHRRRRQNTENEDENSGTDFIGGDLAMSAFADLSFDLPLRVFREAGIHGHVFACAGSLNKLTENAYKELTFQKFRDSFRTSVGVGLVVPTKLFRMEVNYCYILKQHEHDRGKTGVQFSFSSPL